MPYSNESVVNATRLRDYLAERKKTWAEYERDRLTKEDRLKIAQYRFKLKN